MEALIEVLFDRSASISERDDAAMDLAEFDDALSALVTAASDFYDNETVLSSCGASIAEIWRRNANYDEGILRLLAPAAQSEIKASFGSDA